MQIIGCTNCKKTGAFKIQLIVVYDENQCECCNNFTQGKWTYYFCDTECEKQWSVSNEINTKGFKCLNCLDITGKPTGFAFGYESNGVCETCNGTKRVIV